MEKEKVHVVMSDSLDGIKDSGTAASLDNDEFTFRGQSAQDALLTCT